MARAFTRVFDNDWVGPIPWLVPPMAIASIGMWYLLTRLRIGRYILAIGGNRAAAEL